MTAKQTGLPGAVRGALILGSCFAAVCAIARGTLLWLTIFPYHRFSVRAPGPHWENLLPATLGMMLNGLQWAAVLIGFGYLTRGKSVLFQIGTAVATIGLVPIFVALVFRMFGVFIFWS